MSHDPKQRFNVMARKLDENVGLVEFFKKINAEFKGQHLVFLDDTELCVINQFQLIWTVENEKNHISITHDSRYPTWDELVAIKLHFFPDIEMCQIIPKQKDFISIHPNCFHLWEL